jgi:hypothetical protein
MSERRVRAGGAVCAALASTAASTSPPSPIVRRAALPRLLRRHSRAAPSLTSLRPFTARSTSARIYNAAARRPSLWLTLKKLRCFSLYSLRRVERQIVSFGLPLYRVPCVSVFPVSCSNFTVSLHIPFAPEPNFVPTGRKRARPHAPRVVPVGVAVCVSH